MEQLIDAYQRKIDYLRISVTDRCNLRCRYCMPEEGVKNLSHKQILSYEQIVKIVKRGAELGIEKIRLTGGDPLVRKNIAQLVAMLKKINGIKEVSMTTNAILLTDYAVELKQAGLDRVNISLDTLQADKYQEITKVDAIDKVKQGIKTALEYDFKPVKLNVVLLKDFNDDEVFDFIDLTRRFPLHVRFIEWMAFNDTAGNNYLSIDELKAKLEQKITLESIDLKSGNGPARYYTFDDCKGSVGFISPVSNHFCDSCNRLRLTADGKLRFCLCSEQEIDLLTDMGQVDTRALKNKFKYAIENKPDAHELKETENNALESMSQIGG